MVMLKTIGRNERLYILYAIGFAFIYFILVLPWVIKTFDGNNIFFQFLVFNLGLVIFFQLFLKSIITGKKITWLTAIGLSLLFVALDVMSPPYAVNPDGSIVQSGAMPLVSSSSDYLGGSIGQILGIHGFVPLINVGWNYLFTYIAFPLILLILAGLFLKDFVRNL